MHAKVDRPTQDALIKANRKHAGYVRWIQNALLISGEGLTVGGKNIVADGSWGPHTEQAVKAFQAKHEKVKADGWVGANTERLLMLRTGTVPPGRTKVLREPERIPSCPAGTYRSLIEPIPELTGEISSTVQDVPKAWSISAEEGRRDSRRRSTWRRRRTER